MNSFPSRAAVALLATLSLAGVAQAAIPSQSRVAAAADAVVASGVPGVSVYVRDGNHSIVIARGYADQKTKQRLTPADRFRIGSVTKTFVAALVMQLVNEHKLSLDDTVEQHLPGVVPNGDRITLRQLLSHTSGLPDYFNNPRIVAPYSATKRMYAWPHLEIARISAADKHLFAPGAPGKWAYSNTGYYLLGLTVERVTHHSLAVELSQRIFRPLHLSHTALAAGPTPGGSYAHGYSKYFGTMQDVSVFSPTILWAAGGIASTPTDVAAFFRALDAGRIVPLALVREMQAPVAVLPGPPGHREAYGLGLFRATFGCGTVWGHTGDFPGYSTKAFGSRDGSRIAVVIADVDDEKTQTPAEGKAIGDLMTAAYCGG